MAITFELFRILFEDTLYFNVNWIVSIIATFLTCISLSRDSNKWKSLAFPIMVGWHIAGIAPFIAIEIALAIIFVIHNMSIQTIGEILKIDKKNITKENRIEDEIKLQRIKKSQFKKQTKEYKRQAEKRLTDAKIFAKIQKDATKGQERIKVRGQKERTMLFNLSEEERERLKEEMKRMGRI